MLDVNVWTNSLIGRDRELAALGSLLDEAGADGATLLLTGEPGVGKTALLAAAAEMAATAGFEVIRVGGVEYETDVSFAGVSGHLPGDDRVGHTAPAGTPGGLRAPRPRPGRARRLRLRGVLRPRHGHHPAGHVPLPFPAGAVDRAGPDRRRGAHRTRRRGPGSRRGRSASGPRPPVAAVRSRHGRGPGDGRVR